MGKLTGFVLGLLAWLITLPVAISDTVNERAYNMQRRICDKRKEN